jgi:hypothetical protein
MYDLSAGCTKCQYANVAKAVIIANSKDFLIWRGNKHFPTAVWKYNSAPDNYTLFAEELFDSDVTTVMPLNGLNTDEFFTVLSDMPLDTVGILIGDANDETSVLNGWYFNGEWASLSLKASNTTFKDEDCAAIGDWDDDDIGDGVSAQVTFDGQECFIFENKTAGGAHQAIRHIDSVGTLSTRTTVTIKLYHADLGTYANTDYFRMDLYNDDQRTYIAWGSDGLRIQDGATFEEVGTDLVKEDEWQTWTFDIDSTTPAEASMDIYLDGVLVASDFDCSNAVGDTDGRIDIYQLGSNNLNKTYMSLIKIGDDLVEAGYGFTDGTAVGGATLAKAGDLTWNLPTDEVQTDIQGVPGFAYKFTSSAVLANPTSITGLSVHAPIGTVENIWNNQHVPPTGCYVLSGGIHTDYMAYVNNTVEAQYMNLSLVDEGDKIYFGFPQRVNKILLWTAADGPNTNNVSLTSIKYHNASGVATTVGTVVDTTEVGTDMLSQKGYFSWNAPAVESEKRTIIGGDEIPMFWYEVVIDDELVDPTYVYYVRGVPVTESIDPSRGVFAFKRRCWQLAPRNHENKVRYSAQELPNTWNGSDSGYIAFGERPLQVAAPFYNETLLFADTELWMLQGNSPSNFGRIRLSAKIGTNSAESVVNIESGVIVADSLKTVVAWQYFDGFWMFDGVRVWKISAPDIDSFFDEDHEDYIPQAYLGGTVGEYDYATQTVRWSVYSGAGATTPTKVIVMHFPTLNFGIFDYATDIDAMLSVVNDKYYLVGGGHADGRFYLLDSGLTDLLNTVATAVDAWVITRDEFLGYSEGTRQRLMSIWYEAQEAGGQLEIDEYPDGSKTPQNITKTNMSVKGKIFGALQRTLKLFSGQKTTKFRIRNRSKNARMKLLGQSTTVDRDRANE